MTMATKIDDAAGNDPVATRAAPPWVSGEGNGPAAAVAALSLREGDRAALRPKVAAIEVTLAALRDPRDGEAYASALKGLTHSWKTLVECLALGEAPALRVCPHCQGKILLRATRCIECWKMSEASA